MEFKIFNCNKINAPYETHYQNEILVKDEESAKKAFSRDYVCAKYKNNTRSNDNFISSNIVPFDIDNDHTDNPEKWITPDKVAGFFKGVPFVVHFSRNNEKPKRDYSPRPRFHFILLCEEINSEFKYEAIKRKVYEIFPIVDDGAIDAGRFFYGTKNPEVKFYEGNRLLTDFLKEDYGFDINSIEETKNIDKKVEKHDSSYKGLISFEIEGTIPKGTRNSTMSRMAGSIIKQYGDTNEAFNAFLELNKKCEPPLDDDELENIWSSAQKGYKKNILTDKNYVPPEIYNEKKIQYKPRDYSDVGQAEVLANEYRDVLRYSEATSYIVYNKKFWEESNPLAQAIAQELTLKQLVEAKRIVDEEKEKLIAEGLYDDAVSLSMKKLEARLKDDEFEKVQKYKSACSYLEFVVKRRDSKNITGTLKEARPMLLISPEELDADPFLLNTKDGTYDLRKGREGKQDYKASDLITKCTLLSPSRTGKEIWENFLNQTFCGDLDLINYVQRIVGLCAIGKVYYESIIIAHGDGRNGKSTFWNTISKVLGTYSGSISADALTIGCRRNVKPELAEAKGKRLLLACELEEGQRLNTATVKQLASTDEITAEKKFKAPFKFQPSHTLVLYTNHLPKVGATDEGTWRRLIVIPFSAKIEGSSDVKNYSDYLIKNCGEAVLAWIILGAKAIIDEEFKLTTPKVVEEAIAKYKEDNHWLNQFIENCCIKGDAESCKSGDLYVKYRNYCLRTNEYCRSTNDFYNAISLAGFDRRKTNKGSFVYGLSIKTEVFADEFLD